MKETFGQQRMQIIGKIPSYIKVFIMFLSSFEKNFVHSEL